MVVIYYKDQTKISYDKGIYKIRGITSKSPVKNINGIDYFPIFCKDCVIKKYPEYKDKKIPINMYSANVCKYLYGYENIDKSIINEKQSYIKTKDFYIKKYGIIEGLKKWDNYCKKQSYTNTFEYKNKVFGMTKSEFNDFNKSRAVTKDNLIKKYGVADGTLKWQSYIKKQSYAGVKLEYFIDKYGIDKGTIKYNELIEKKKITLKNLKKKYGEEEGSLRYQRYINKKNLYNSKYISKKEVELINKIENLLGIDIQRQVVIEYNNNVFIVDGLYKNIVIEYNGSYWHASNKIYKETDIIKFPMGIKKYAKEIWEADDNRRKRLNQLGYTVLYYWEDYTKEEHNNFLNKLKEYVKKEKSTN